MANKRIWTDDRCKRLSELYSDYTNAELASMFGVSHRSVDVIAFKLGLRKSREFMDRHCKATRFVKGQIPANKGRKQSEWMPPDKIEKSKKTRFKIGSIPHNTLPLGTERASKDGYIKVKVQNHGKQCEKWKFKQVLVWEKANGPVPPGHVVAFRDGNIYNYDLANLELRSRREHLDKTALNIPEEVRKMVGLRAALSRQINKYSKTDSND